MLTALTIAHIAISFILVVLVLIQDPKGDASGLLGGGGNKSFFGATGANTFLTKATRTVAVLFASGCLALAYMTSQTAGTSEGVLDRVELPASGPAKDDQTPQLKTPPSKDTKSQKDTPPKQDSK